MNKINIAIDGYSACGKSSTARELAQRLGYIYLDTGAMYRAITLEVLRKKADIHDEDVIESLLALVDITFNFSEASDHCAIFLNGENVENEIRSMEVSENVSRVSALKVVRDKMTRIQRDIARDKGVVMDGRDIGSTVLPDAELKIFMVADVLVRAKRRQLELVERGLAGSLEGIIDNIKQRDDFDSNREESPLRQADDAIVIDTTALTFEEQVKKIELLARSKMLITP
ncbi:MAG: (d)CMP kinase [Cyclobacteriaceae bacterium]|nr:(d)CMP kinase [Cyclobacteriaceae bacterium]